MTEDNQAGDETVERDAERQSYRGEALEGADFGAADLRGVDFTGADLRFPPETVLTVGHCKGTWMPLGAG